MESDSSSPARRKAPRRTRGPNMEPPGMAQQLMKTGGIGAWRVIAPSQPDEDPLRRTRGPNTGPKHGTPW